MVNFEPGNINHTSLPTSQAQNLLGITLPVDIKSTPVQVTNDNFIPAQGGQNPFNQNTLLAENAMLNTLFSNPTLALETMQKFEKAIKNNQNISLSDYYIYFKLTGNARAAFLVEQVLTIGNNKARLNKQDTIELEAFIKFPLPQEMEIANLFILTKKGVPLLKEQTIKLLDAIEERENNKFGFIPKDEDSQRKMLEFYNRLLSKQLYLSHIDYYKFFKLTGNTEAALLIKKEIDFQNKKGPEPTNEEANKLSVYILFPFESEQNITTQLINSKVDFLSLNKDNVDVLTRGLHTNLINAIKTRLAENEKKQKKIIADINVQIKENKQFWTADTLLSKQKVLTDENIKTYSEELLVYAKYQIEGSYEDKELADIIRKKIASLKPDSRVKLTDTENATFEAWRLFRTSEIANIAKKLFLGKEVSVKEIQRLYEFGFIQKLIKRVDDLQWDSRLHPDNKTANDKELKLILDFRDKFSSLLDKYQKFRLDNVEDGKEKETGKSPKQIIYEISLIKASIATIREERIFLTKKAKLILDIDETFANYMFTKFPKEITKKREDFIENAQQVKKLFIKEELEKIKREIKSAKEQGKKFNGVNPSLIRKLRENIQYVDSLILRDIDSLSGTRKSKHSYICSCIDKPLTGFYLTKDENKIKKLNEFKSELYSTIWRNGQFQFISESSLLEINTNEIKKQLDKLFDKHKGVFLSTAQANETKAEIIKNLEDALNKIRTEDLARKYDRELFDDSIGKLVIDLTKERDELSVLTKELTEVQSKSPTDIFVELLSIQIKNKKLTTDDVKKITEQALAKGYTPKELRLIAANISLINSLPPHILEQLSLQYVDPLQVAAQLSKGILRQSKNSFLLDSSILDTVQSKQRELQSKDISKVHKELEALLKQEAEAVDSLAKTTEKGIDWTDNWFPFFSSEDDLLEMNQGMYADKIRNLKNRIKQKREELSSYGIQKLQLDLVISTHEINIAQNNGEHAKADLILENILRTYGRNLKDLSPDLWEKIIKSGKTPSEYGTLQRYLEARLINTDDIREFLLKKDTTSKEFEVLQEFLDKKGKNLFTQLTTEKDSQKALDAASALIKELEEIKANSKNEELKKHIDSRIGAIKSYVALSGIAEKVAFNKDVDSLNVPTVLKDVLKFTYENKGTIEQINDYLLFLTPIGSSAYITKQLLKSETVALTRTDDSLNPTTASAIALLNRDPKKVTALDLSIGTDVALREIDNDPSIQFLQQSVSQVHETLPHLQKLLIAGLGDKAKIEQLEKELDDLKSQNRGSLSNFHKRRIDDLEKKLKAEKDKNNTKYEPFVDFLREQGVKLKNGLSGPDAQKHIAKVNALIDKLKEISKNTKDPSLKAKIDARIEGLEAVIKLTKNEDIKKVLDILTDKSKLKADSWKEWIKTDGPVVIASIAVAVALVALTVATFGAATPLWAIALASAAGGLIGKEVAREVQYLIRNAYDTDLQNGFTWSDRSNIMAWADKYILNPKEKKDFLEIVEAFGKDVAAPYIKEFAISFAITFATCGLGRIAGSALSKGVNLSKAACQKLSMRLFGIRTSMATLEKQFGKKVVKDAIEKGFFKHFLKELPQEYAEEATEAILEKTLDRIYPGLGVLSSFLVCSAQSVNLKTTTKVDAGKIFAAKLELEGHTVTKIGIDGSVDVTSYTGHKFKFTLNQNGTYSFEANTDTKSDNETVKTSPPNTNVDPFNVNSLPVADLSKIPDITSKRSYTDAKARIVVDNKSLLPKDVKARTIVKFSSDGKTVVSTTIILNPDLHAAISDPKHPKHLEAKKTINEEISHAHKSSVDPLSPSKEIKYSQDEYALRRSYQELTDEANANAKFLNVVVAKTQKGQAVAEIGKKIQAIDALRKAGKNAEADVLVKETLKFAKKHGITNSDLDLFNNEYKVNINPNREFLIQSYNDTLATRTGKLGVIRSGQDLTINDIVQLINEQQKPITPKQIQEIIDSFPEVDRPLVRQIFNTISQFGNLQSVNNIHEEITTVLGNEYVIYTEADASLGTNLNYLSTKGVGPKPDLIRVVKSLKEIDPAKLGDKKLAFIVDDILLTKLENDPALRRHLLEIQNKLPGKIKFVYPQAWETGINPFNHNQDFGKKIAEIMNRAKKLSNETRISLDKAISEILNGSIRERVAKLGLNSDFTLLTRTTVKDTNEAIAKRLTPTEVTEEQINDALKELLGENLESYKQVVLELLAHDLTILSNKQIAEEFVKYNQRIKELAKQKGISEDKVYFVVPVLKPSYASKYPGVQYANQSYGLLTMHFRLANNIPSNRIITLEDANNLPPDTMIVVFDDISGRGHSLAERYEELRNMRDLKKMPGVRVDYKGEIVIAPFLGIKNDGNVFHKQEKGRLEDKKNPTLGDTKFTYLPVTEEITDFRNSDYYKSLSLDQQAKFEKIFFGLGYDENGTSVVWEFMTPNNNFGIAQYIATLFMPNAGVKFEPAPIHTIPDDLRSSRMKKD